MYSVMITSPSTPAPEVPPPFPFIEAPPPPPLPGHTPSAGEIDWVLAIVAPIPPPPKIEEPPHPPHPGSPATPGFENPLEPDCPVMFI